jgi:hypothetical protein
MLKELEEKAMNLESAQKAAQAQGATEREIADCKIIEQEYIGFHKRAQTLVQASGTADEQSAMAKFFVPNLV